MEAVCHLHSLNCEFKFTIMAFVWLGPECRITTATGAITRHVMEDENIFTTELMIPSPLAMQIYGFGYVVCVALFFFLSEISKFISTPEASKLFSQYWWWVKSKEIACGVMFEEKRKTFVCVIQNFSNQDETNWMNALTFRVKCSGSLTYTISFF